MQADHTRALEALSEHFGDRFRRHAQPEDGIVASVLPRHSDDVRRASQIAAQYSLPLLPVGAGTAPDSVSEPKENAIQVRFDLMSDMRLPEGEEEWIEAQPGATWLQLDNELHRRQRSLAVYPTSAPRATVGGWLATDGIGVGSFEYGRLYENVISASVVERGGGLREIGGDELGHFFGPRRTTGVVVGARLRTRPGGEDRVFAATFEDARGLTAAVGDLVSSDAPLWHLAFVSPVMAAARGLRARYLLFGVYPRSRDGDEWWELRRRVLRDHGGTEFDSWESSRVWGERFFPVDPGHPTPHASREFVPLADLPRMLNDGKPADALQGTVSRSGEALLLTLGGADRE
jgi:FAD/FMN-containing dehydrogenase